MANINPTSTNTTNKTAAKAGVYTALGLILYFVIMRLFNLHRTLELHYLNIVVLFFGLRYAIKHIISLKGEIRYFEGLKAGLMVTIISLLIFNIFMGIYISVDSSFLEHLKENLTLGNAFPSIGIVFNVMGILTVEGLASGFIMTFSLMQFYKAESSETI